MIRQVLVALDGSPRAPGVMAAAVEICARFGAKLLPFRAIQIPPEFPPSAHVTRGDPLPVYLKQNALEEILSLLDDVDVEWQTPVVAYGQPWRAILQAAEERDVDLIVLGSHGYDALDRVLGTTAGKVVNMARRNVLVVHNRVDPPDSRARLAAEQEEES